MVYAMDSKSIGGNTMRVRLPLCPPFDALRLLMASTLAENDPELVEGRFDMLRTGKFKKRRSGVFIKTLLPQLAVFLFSKAPARWHMRLNQ